MNKKASEIFADFRSDGLLIDMQGPDNTVTRITPVENAGPGALVFVDREEFVNSAIGSEAAVVVTSPALRGQLSSKSTATLLISTNVKLAQALLGQAYADRDLHDTEEWGRVHPSAVIHPSAQIPPDTVVGPGAVIGARVRVGSRSVILAKVVIEHDVVLGEDCIVHPNVVIAYDCEIGNRVTLKPGCIIGGEGFGFAQDADKRSHRIPQTGKVVIEDDVTIGSNCTIDRATYRETRIAAGCKLDNLCQIAHNVIMGRDCILAAQSGIAGSTHIGKRLLATGQSAVKDHVTVADDVTLLMRPGVAHDILESGTYAGTPVQKFKDYTRNTAIAQNLTKLRSRIRELERRLEELGSGNKSDRQD